VFERPASGWANATQEAILTASDGAAGDGMSSVGISGDTIVAGAFGHDVGANRDQGAVYVFSKPAGGWHDMNQTAELTASDGAADGGWTTWKDEGRPTTAAGTAPAAAAFSGRPRPRLRRTLPEVEAAQERGATLVDARPRHLFLGAPGAPSTGHIPGARCLPYQELVDGATGLWATPDAVARLARDAGIDPDTPPRELIATCGSGVSAAVAMLALERIGLHCDGVYDGAFNEWSADAGRPVAYGAAV
jgi:thiosulfate/3-mercaptopyruvate sulfurtransferase